VVVTRINRSFFVLLGRAATRPRRLAPGGGAKNQILLRLLGSLLASLQPFVTACRHVHVVRVPVHVHVHVVVRVPGSRLHIGVRYIRLLGSRLASSHLWTVLRHRQRGSTDK